MNCLVRHLSTLDIVPKYTFVLFPSRVINVPSVWVGDCLWCLITREVGTIIEEIIEVTTIQTDQKETISTTITRILAEKDKKCRMLSEKSGEPQCFNHGFNRFGIWSSMMLTSLCLQVNKTLSTYSLYTKQNKSI